MASELEERNSQVLDEIWNIASEHIDKVITSEQERQFILSIAMGATVAAELFLNNCESIRPFWREGSIEKGKEICNLFSFIMLSQCYRWINQQPGADPNANLPKEVMSTKLMYIFEVAPERWMEDFTKFDEQFNYDLDNHPHIIHLSALIIAKICQLCGHQCLAWGEIEFPVHEFKDIMSPSVLIDGAPLREQKDINVVATALSTSIDAMNKYIEEAK
ncbi:MAG: hypothetical protein IKR78_02735 [Dehalococcoidales bacterium]|nr:hypothetical protein [Dehalococcoidales bacterium]